MDEVARQHHGRSGDGSWAVRIGDAKDVLAHMEAESADCLVSSPPYYWQRDYGSEGQIGLEDTVEEYVARLVAVMHEARRVLRRSGTAFLVLGDTYYSGKGRSGGTDTKQPGRRFQHARAVERAGFGLPRKSLIGVPWRVALALQADGWTLRSAVIWRKAKRMDEPRVFDRPWGTTEFVFILSRSIRYHFDRSALRGQEDVWEIPVNNALRRYRHAAPFPVELAERCILAGCRPGGVVLDPFAGSGTTLLAACRNGRDAIGIELNPNYAMEMVDRLHRG